jgi:hypothetical protein
MSNLFTPTALIVLLLGASVIAGIGAAANYVTKTEGNTITVKSVLRDFLIGIILTSITWMFVPESFSSIGEMMESVASTIASPMEAMGGGGSSGDGGTDLDLHVGPPSF